MFTDLQKRTAQGIVNVFETGRIRGDYGRVVVAKNDAGHLTYGRSQTTLASGNLFLLVQDYCRAPGAALADRLDPYLRRLDDRDLSLDHDMTFRRHLKDAGDDPIMCRVQDTFFDRYYWRPAVSRAASIGLGSQLGATVVYDSIVHGSFVRIRDRTNAAIGTPAQAGEAAWVARYLDERRRWLLSFDPAKSLLPKTVYRMDELQKLVAAAAWSLPLPLRVRGLVMDQATLGDEGEQPGSEEEPVTAAADEDRILRLRTPLMTGEDVREIQAALSRAGFVLDVDGRFGPLTESAVRRYQAAKSLTVDGMVGPITRLSLGL